MSTNSRQFYEVWEDTATVRDLVRALVITVGLTMGAYLLAPNEPPAPLIAGLSGAVVGFIISSVITPTKRTLDTVEIDDADTDGTDTREVRV